MAGRRKKNRTHKTVEPATPIPKTFIVKHGKTSNTVSALIQDMRQIFEPNTASRLKERLNAKLKDYVSIAGPLGVSHMLMFSQTEVFTNLRIMKFPKGPTLHFQVEALTLIKDIKAAQKSPLSPGMEYSVAPILVLNNFGGEEKEIKLMATFLQNIFPAIDVAHMKLSEARRCILFSLEKETGLIQMRHYLIRIKPVGISKSIKKVISNKVGNLDVLDDISEFILQDATLSESEMEDNGASNITLNQKYVGNIKKNSQRSISLVEIGPRLGLKLVKITDGMNGGKVLFHNYIKKEGIASDDEQLDETVNDEEIVDGQRNERHERNVDNEDDDNDNDDDDGSEISSESEDINESSSIVDEISDDDIHRTYDETSNDIAESESEDEDEEDDNEMSSDESFIQPPAKMQKTELSKKKFVKFQVSKITKKK